MKSRSRTFKRKLNRIKFFEDYFTISLFTIAFLSIIQFIFESDPVWYQFFGSFIGGFIYAVLRAEYE